MSEFKDNTPQEHIPVLTEQIAERLSVPQDAVVVDATVGHGGHSLLFGSIIMVAVLIGTSRGIRRKQWILLSVGVLMHLALDAMWADPSTLWWPFLGWEFTSTGIGTFPEYASDILSDPWMWAGEAAGLAYLVHLWRSSDLDDPTARGVFLSTGRVSAPIDRK